MYGCRRPRAGPDRVVQLIVSRPSSADQRGPHEPPPRIAWQDDLS
ncbi:hypothetical protein LY41_000241 [Prauserella halophila]|nr:hypothetical protein [Prauserella halophila]